MLAASERPREGRPLMIANKLTWEILVQNEPGLKVLLADAELIQDDLTTVNFCANAAWYGYSGHPGLKPRLLRLVGWRRIDLDDQSDEEQLIRSQQAYSLAYHRIYDVLPNCRNCGCLQDIR